MPHENSSHPADINWHEDTIYVSGKPGTPNIPRISQAYHHCVENSGYKNIILDFTKCGAAFESFMLPTICLARHYLKKSNANTELRLPESNELRSLFHNSNWQHLIAPNRFEPTIFDGSQHCPAIGYSTPDEQYEAVNKVIDVVLSSIEGGNRSSLKALEWAINEITDNVLNHAQSNVGGFVQASTFAESSTVEFVVADAGIGIAKSLGIHRHQRALEQAIQEGITRNKKIGAGNGLFGSYQIATLSGGQFQIHSGKASMTSTSDDPKYYPHKTPCLGTSIVTKINFSEENLLGKALKFDRKPHEPGHDYIKGKYEKDDALLFKMKEEAKSFGSRELAHHVKTRISNLLHSNGQQQIIIDFSDVIIVSSSFADEVFGKLFAELGPINFMSKIRLQNMDPTVVGLIDRAMKQRPPT